MAYEWDPINRVYTVVPKNRQVMTAPEGRKGQTQAAVQAARGPAQGVSAIKAPEGAKGRVGIPATKKPTVRRPQLPQGPALFGTADQPYSQVAGLLNDPTLQDENVDTTGLLNSILATIGDGGGTGRNDARDYARAMQAAKAYERAGLAAQGQYAGEAERLYREMLAQAVPSQYGQMRTDIGTDYAAREKAVKDYLSGQLAAGETAITGAGIQGATAISEAEKALLAQLTAPTAYQNVPLAMTTPEMQALGSQLAAYGASGEQAAAARQESTDYARQLAEIQARETGQLNTAQQNYITALRNAGVGAATAARQGLAGNVASQLAALRGGIAANQATTLSDLAGARSSELRGISQAEMESQIRNQQAAQDLRQQLLTKGFETGLAGKQSRAEAEAAAIKEFGVPKKKKGKGKK